jgi:hypothetical protein
LDPRKIVGELIQERTRLERAIAALDKPVIPKVVVRKVRVFTRQRVASDGQKRGGVTPEGRKRLSLAMKKRWAERKKMGS